MRESTISDFIGKESDSKNLFRVIEHVIIRVRIQNKETFIGCLPYPAWIYYWQDMVLFLPAITEGEQFYKKNKDSPNL